MIVIVDSGGANVGSIVHALERLGKKAIVTAEKENIQLGSHVILPGVGAAAHAMARLKRLDLVDTLRGLTQPVLGICLGMQLLYDYSEEGEVACLGIIPGTIKRLVPMPPTEFPLEIQKEYLAVPHMGWNSLTSVSETPLFSKILQNSYFYFAHSYIAPLNDATVATTIYGHTFSAAVQWKNYYGVQFHPERSSLVGAQLLENFLRL
jgi:imidazole glycerol-phosphate synthase subunit HisH